MARPSVIPGIKTRLEAWLDEREAAYLAQPEATRQPTLPVILDGKLNVRIAGKAIQLKQLRISEGEAPEGNTVGVRYLGRNESPIVDDYLRAVHRIGQWLERRLWPTCTH